MFLIIPEWAKIAIGTLAVLFMILSRAALRYPHVGWLRQFDVESHLSPARRAQLRRSGNVMAGAEMILMGLALPIGYVVLTLMVWGDFSSGITVAVLAASLALIVAGIYVMIRASRARSDGSSSEEERLHRSIYGPASTGTGEGWDGDRS